MKSAVRTAHWWCAIVGAVCLIAGCGGAVDPRAGDPAGSVRYLSLGDSFTMGVGAGDEEKAFPALLADHWRSVGCEVELSNVGQGGYTTAQVLADQVPQIAAFAPTVITFESGANDIAKGVGVDEYRRNVAAVLDAAKASGARVVVLPQPEWFRTPVGRNVGDGQSARDAFDEALRQEATARGAEFADLRTLFAKQADDQLWSGDGLHPTADAYSGWADALAASIATPCG